MHAFFGERFEICGKRCHESFTFTRTHFGNSALIEHYAAYKLDVKVSHAENSVACFSYGSKSLGKKIVKTLALLVSVHKFLRTRFKFFFAHSLVSIFKRYDFIYCLINLFEFPVVVRRENFTQNTHFLTSLSQIC